MTYPIALSMRYTEMSGKSELADFEQENGYSQASGNGVPDASWLLSGLYCMIVIILSLVICSSFYITSDVTDVTVDVYFIFLSIVGTIWLSTFKPLATSCCREPRRFHEIKSTHSTNRWLKGILVLFGLAIIIKDVLDFLVIFEYEEKDCRKPIYYLVPIAQISFIIAEVNFLFRFSKIHLQQYQRLSRFGIMHVMATNLSIWMLIILEESMHTVPRSYEQSPTTSPSDFNPYAKQMLASYKNEEMKSANLSPNNYAGNQPLGQIKGCYCNTTYCTAVTGAHTFLYPFLIEFSLVASFMMYVVWKNVGTKPRHSGPGIKPAYKFYKSYKGVFGGSITLIATTVVLIFINNAESDVSESERSYETETTALIITNSYMITVEVFMLAACLLGLVLFRREPRPISSSMNLDAVLLMVTITGTASLDIYYIFAVYASLISPNYSYKWIWGTIYPIVDLSQCIVQVGFLLYGLSRAPVVEDDASNETTFRSSSLSDRDSGINDGFTNTGFNDKENMVIEVELESSTDPDENEIIETSFVDDVPVQYDALEENAPCAITKEMPSTSNNHDDGGQDKREDKMAKDEKLSKGVGVHDEIIRERIQKHNERLKVAPPNTTRLYIREAVMFLLIANACLWMFWSLEGTAFKLYTYPYQYYMQTGYSARNTWYTVSMFCLPLSIFFRMHSCACLFEVWSLT